MILSARVGASGFYDAAAVWIAGQAGRPLRLLALTIAVGGVLSALLVNDIVVFAMTPLLCAGLTARDLDPRPFCSGLPPPAMPVRRPRLIGNPQNILIGQAGNIGFWPYFASAAVPSLVGLVDQLRLHRLRLAGKPDGARRRRAARARSPSTACRSASAASRCCALLVLFATPLPREMSALLVAACLIVSRVVPTRQLLDEIDLPLLILFAALFVVNDAFARTGLPEEAVRSSPRYGLLPDRVAFLAPIALLLSNTIGNVPAVVMILKVWHGIPQGTLVGLAILSTLAGNLFLVGSLANLIVAERAKLQGVRLTFRDHAKAGVPITILSMLFAGLWLWLGGYMPL